MERPGTARPVPTLEAWGDRTRAEKLERMTTAPATLRTLVADHAEATLHQRPDPDAWSAVEVVCHLRDIDDMSMLRFRQMLQMEDPMLPAAAMPTDAAAWGLLDPGAYLIDPMRWALDRQYLRNDVHEAATSFGRRRGELLTFLRLLDEAQWARGSIHPTGGRKTFDGWLTILAWHDDNHLAQLARVLVGEPGG